MILNAFMLAFRQIRRNFLRAFLTMLGVIIGVGAVVVMISIGNGTTQMITDRISSLGSNLLLVFPARAMNPSGANLRRNFSLQEAQRLQALTQEYIQDRISSLGSNLLLVFPARAMNPSGANLRRNFSLQEAQRLQALTQEYIQAIAPISQSSVVLQFQSQNTTTQAQGVTEGFFEVTQWDSSEGRGFEESEYRVGSNVCLIGESVKKNLFKNSNPLGQKIRLNNIVCECIGVLESKGQGGMGNDQDDVILLPMKAFLRSVSGNNSLFFVNRIMLRAKDNVDSSEMLPALSKALREVRNVRAGERDSFEINNSLFFVNRIMLRAKDNVDSSEMLPALSKALREVRNVRAGERDSFEIMDTKQIEQTLTSTTQRLTGLLGMIAGVSLIVGGIGIMNIMLVSVTERTKEIGTRMAIGALQSEVLMQFLIESVTLSSCGGLIGIVWAFFASLGLSYYMEIPFIFDVPTAIIAFLFSAFIGILFGYLPARRASKLNPIDAGLSYYMEIPFIFDVPTAIIAFLFSAFIGILFGYLPARRASKLNPIDALRHE